MAETAAADFFCWWEHDTGRPVTLMLHPRTGRLFPVGSATPPRGGKGWQPTPETRRRLPAVRARLKALESGDTGTSGIVVVAVQDDVFFGWDGDDLAVCGLTAPSGERIIAGGALPPAKSGCNTWIPAADARERLPRMRAQLHSEAARRLDRLLGRIERHLQIGRT